MKILVTGAGGYLGGAITRALSRRGDAVVTLQRGCYPALAQLGVETYRGDICDPHILIEASRGCDAVLHVAARTGVWGPRAGYFRTNVTGTAAIIQACRHNQIPRLVYTSTPSVVFDGGDEADIDESRPYPASFLNHYQASKAAAEQRVLAANCERLATVALRPHLIWGPGDPHLVGRILDRARNNRLRLVRADNRIDTTYIDNAVDAHLLAVDSLQPGGVCAGKAYFISNGEPLPLAAMINRILDAAGLPPVRKTLPAGIAYGIGLVSELIYKLAGIKTEPQLTRFVARQLTRDHWYDISASRRDLGYQPRISIEQGLRQLQQSLTSANGRNLERTTG